MKEPNILIVIKDGIVQSAVLCSTMEELHDRFADEILDRGIVPSDEDFDNGYFEFEDTEGSVCMVHPTPEAKAPSGRRDL
jgi:hypothetical protein